VSVFIDSIWTSLSVVATTRGIISSCSHVVSSILFWLTVVAELVDWLCSSATGMASSESDSSASMTSLRLMVMWG